MANAKTTKKAVFQGLLEIDDTKDLSKLLDRLGITPRNWEVLEARRGFEKPITLSQIATRHNFTHTRAAQIAANSSAKIIARATAIAPALAYLEVYASALSITLKQGRYASFLSLSQQALIDANWSEVSPKSVRRLMIAFREAATTDENEMAVAFPKLKTVIHRLATIDLSGPFNYTIHSQPLSAASLAELVLMEVKEPLHYRQIHSEAEKRQPGKPPSLKAVIEALQEHPRVYARVSAGIYGLTAWGLETVQPYQALVTTALEEGERPLTEGEIFQIVNMKRSVKKTTLCMCLNLNPNFYKSSEGTYGLRVWLPARDKQTIRTPRWKVEDPKSYQRLKLSDAPLTVLE